MAQTRQQKQEEQKPEQKEQRSNRIAQSLIQIQNKWQKRWADAKVFEANVQKGKKKFMLTFPYPYVNGLPHIGHLFTIMRVESFARFKRHQDFNVLFPQGWHATGSPIVNAAKRIQEKEPKQLKILQDLGIPEKDIVKFEQPEHWPRYFCKEYKKDLQAMGLSIDWRREFVTTQLNPHYNKFIEWQFRKLKEKNYVIQGKFPVVWCPKCNNPVSDHARVEGEGETPQEFVLVKHTLDDGRHIVSATLRHDTIYGITNLYVHPDIEYVEAKVKSPTKKAEKGKQGSEKTETWILSEYAAEHLKEQDYEVTIIGKVKGKDLIGKKTKEFGGRKVLVLPALFLDPRFGTGLVHSVPSDSADDLIALWDLQKDEATIKKYGLNSEEVKAIKPIPVLDTPGYGNVAAEVMLKKHKATSQHQRALLEQIKKDLYKLSFYEATFNEQYQKGFSKNLHGKKVSEGKDIIKQDLLKQGWIEMYYQLTGKVVCRCLTPSIVKIVDDQWFLNYGDKDWKKVAHACLKQMKLYPEKARTQFEYVIDWLHEWACTREEGLGTRLPWAQRWLIESLSDSTIYNAYYTFNYLLEKIPLEKIDDAVFDYLLLGKENKENKGKKPALPGIEAMRNEFLYWYPVDFRNSGKDLIQNHLTFYIFNHVAIFPQEHWPKGIGVNGWVTVDGNKMSKSLGNMIPVRTMAAQFSADVSRITILYGGEDLDDPNWDSNFAETMVSKLEQLRLMCQESYNKGRTGKLEAIDQWAVSKLNQTIRDATGAMEKTFMRSAIQHIFFDIQQMLRWYRRRTHENPHKEVMNQIIETQVVMLAPFTPHICEEIWEALGKNKDEKSNDKKNGTHFVSQAPWPKSDAKLIHHEADLGEELIEKTLSSLNTVLELAKIEKPKKIAFFISPAWKYGFYEKLRKEMEKTRNPGALMKAVMTAEYKPYGSEIAKMVPRVAKGGLPEQWLSQNNEMQALERAQTFFKETYDCAIEVVLADKSKEPKAQNASPGKVAILVE